jgi:hypothetical protein
VRLPTPGGGTERPALRHQPLLADPTYVGGFGYLHVPAV